MFFRFPVTDSHIHIHSLQDLELIEKAANVGEYERFTVLSDSFVPDGVAGNLSVAYAKLSRPNKIYAYASLHMPEEGPPDPSDLVAQAKLYEEAGFDGIKMIDGKPTLRYQRKVPLDDPCYDPLFSFLEKTGMPVLYHSGDPVEFWDSSLIPEWAREAGYLYDSRYPSAEQIRQETLGILQKHPKLHLTLAHLFFLSNTNSLDLASQMLEQYPYLLFDLTPGWEMFEGFGRNLKGWKTFLEQYADRLVYGTDLCANNYDEVLVPLRKCLETGEIFEKSGVTCYGAALSDTALKKIYQDTYRSMVQPNDPRPMRVSLLLEHIPDLVQRTKQYKTIDQDKALEEIHTFASLLSSL